MEFLSRAYYKYVFLRRNPVARAISSLVPSPSVPSKDTWEKQYQQGYWDRLSDLSEQAHNAIVISYVAHLKPGGSILELGCGKGTLVERLKQVGYRSYTGIDISESAVNSCGKLVDEKTSFLVGDAENHVLQGSFDLILLNESVYYFIDPGKALKRYSQHLTQDGIFVISVFDKERTRSIREALKSAFDVIDETVVSNSKGTWYCFVLSPHPSEREKASAGNDNKSLKQLVSPSQN